jgi:hypothetical protein
MLLRDFLIGVYGMNKAKTQPSHYAYKFAEKHNLELGLEYSKMELLKLVIKFSSEATREKALNIVSTIKENCFKLGSLRTESYKKICSVFHPDNNDTGDEESFKVIQEIKEFLWDYKGSPRKEIKLWQWGNEREFVEGGGFKYGFTYRKNN